MAACIANARVEERIQCYGLLNQLAICAYCCHNDSVETALLDSGVESHSLTALCEVLYLTDAACSAVDECVDCCLRVSHYITLCEVVFDTCNITTIVDVELGNDILQVWSNLHTKVLNREVVLHSNHTWECYSECATQIAWEHLSTLVLACTSKDSLSREYDYAILQSSCKTGWVALWVVVRSDHEVAGRTIRQAHILLLDVALCRIYAVDYEVGYGLCEAARDGSSRLAFETESRNNHLQPRVLDHIEALCALVLVDVNIDLCGCSLNLEES